MHISISRAAGRDLDRVLSFLHDTAPQTVPKATDRIKGAFNLIAHHPIIGRVAASGLRVYSVRFGRSGYAVRYRIDADQVVILRFWHGREDRP
jgi:plasmid stabilization system protein ParE